MVLCAGGTNLDYMETKFLVLYMDTDIDYMYTSFPNRTNRLNDYSGSSVKYLEGRVNENKL